MSKRQAKKQDRAMKQVAKELTEKIDFSEVAKKAAEEAATKMTALDILNGIKETWTEDEIEELITWLRDKEAGPWG